ncbi:MAG: hypothetical protein R6U98_14460 [Pirellulaceae bacterium]
MPEMAFGLMILGKALAAEKRYGEAESCLKDALSIFRKHYPQESKRCTHDAFFALINALRVQNKNKEVATLLDDRVDRLQNQRPSSTLADAYAYLSVTEEKKGEYE